MECTTEEDEDDNCDDSLFGTNRILPVDLLMQRIRENTVCGFCVREDPPLISTLKVEEKTFGIATDMYACCSVQQHDKNRKPHCFAVEAKCISNEAAKSISNQQSCFRRWFSSITSITMNTAATGAHTNSRVEQVEHQD
jgi:hypothetical protein